MSSQLLTLENDSVQFVLNSALSATILDKKQNILWEMMPTCYQENGSLSDAAIWNRKERCYMDRYPSRFDGKLLADGSVEVTVLDHLREVRGTLILRCTLENDWVVFAIASIDESLPSLIFPPFIPSEKLVIPNEIGQLLKTPIAESLFIMPASGWNMRFFGGLRGEAGWMAIVEDGYADSGVYMSGMGACAGWQKTLGKWVGRKVVRFGLCDNGYVGMAKKFRAYAKEHGLYKSLKEKIAQVPSVDNLVGGRCISFFQGYTHHADNALLWMSTVSPESKEKDGKKQVVITHADAKTIIEEAKEAGMKKGYFNLRGWLAGGYDESHPDVWPPEPAIGTINELKAITTDKDPYLGLLHDNYQDIYQQSPSFPRYVMKTPDGRLKAGGTWHGGRSYVVNPQKALEYAKRNKEHFVQIGLRGIFLDTIGGAHFQEDYAPEHPLTRSTDAEAKCAIARLFKDSGFVVGTEYGSDYSSTVVDFIETRTNRIAGVTIPLFPLVYHDSVVTLRYKNGTDDFESASDTEDLLWGYAKLWAAGNLENWRKTKEDFKKSLIVDEFQSRIALDEMTDHRFLNSECTIEQTQYACGISVIANFSSETVTIMSRTIEPNGYAIIG